MKKGALLVGASLWLSGCVATQKDVLDLENQTDNLKAQITDLKQTISSMQANQADLSVQMKQLHEDLSAFTETSKANQELMSRLSSKLDDMSAGVKSSVAAIGTTLTNQQAKSLEEQKAELAKQAEGGNPTDLFNTADVRLQTKSYALAAKGFAQYVEKFPKGALIDVATFKLGQAYFGERKWESAGRQFAVVLEKYPKSEMTASSRLLYAMCLVNMKKSLAEARQYLESIPNDFPTSPEAKAAARELKKLGKKGT
ncbi:MAG: outer membrane protein assembly factor BamD [Elusimicrobia bacterium]|nr:outer membrane protein assembly factor BamD [Elusimicrobiota bacterium]